MKNYLLLFKGNFVKMFACLSRLAIPIAPGMRPDWELRADYDDMFESYVLHFTLSPELKGIMQFPDCMKESTFFGEHKNSTRGYKYNARIRSVKIIRNEKDFSISYLIFETPYTTLEASIYNTVEDGRERIIVGDVVEKPITIVAYPENCRMTERELLSFLHCNDIKIY